MGNVILPQEDAVEQIAVIGLAGRFPGAKNVRELWQNLRNGVDSIHRFTDHELESLGIDPAVLSNPNYVKAKGLIEGAELFDASFFGFSPGEAEMIEPQQRVFLECAWEALENAGYDPTTYAAPIGVFAGASMNDYAFTLFSEDDSNDTAQLYHKIIGNEKDFLATRVSYKLNLKGPSLTVQTGCSTSLVAVQLACQSLLNYQCSMALAGGVCIILRQKGGYFYQQGGIPSPDGYCRAFDAKAQGTVLSEGVGIVVLKRLSEALADGDTIHAVIKGSAINNDGSTKVGFTAPSVDGQAEVIAMAQSLSGVPVDTITYIEAHGTGTPLGDPIEIDALTQAFRAGTDKKRFCAIGSVKTNIGHLDVAAGVAGLIKTVLMLKHREIPPSLHFEEPNRNIDFTNSPFYVNTALSEWKTDGFPRRAGVSSFGIGGTNVHAVLEEAPTVGPSGKSRPWHLMMLSARTSTALDKITKNLVEKVKQHPHLNLADVAYTLQVGRKDFNHRRMLVCQSVDDCVTSLGALDPGRVFTVHQEQRNPPIAFMFSGQGSQYVNMGLELYRTESQFREEIDRCSEILRPHLSLDLRDILYPEGGNLEEAAHKLEQTSITQPALFAIEYALAKLWISWGVRPTALVGHSIGEYVAACLAGVFSLGDALSLVAARGRLIQELPGGSMLAVPLSEKEIQPLLGENLSLAVINSPSMCAVSGDREAIEDLEKQLSQSNIDCRKLHTSHAFHSQTVDPILDTFAQYVRQVTVNPPQIPFLSNVTGSWISADEAMAPDYWARHLRHTVRFSDCVQELLKEPNRVLLEVGPGTTLSTLARQHPNKINEHIVLSSTRHPKEQVSDIAFILNTLGRLWLAGIEVDWAGFYKDERRHRLALPTYPFERQRYWVEPAKHPQGIPASQAGLITMEEELQFPARPETASDHLATRDQELPSEFVPPQNEVEQAIANIWGKLLGVEQVGIYDNYFDLGGTSLLASRLFAEVENVLGKRIPLAILINAPTVKQLADILSRDDWSAAWSSLVPIQPDGSRPPLFCIHAAGGNVLLYRDLARHLGQDQPVYGLQSQGLDGKQPFHARIEDMASHYVEEIRTIQPKGPYLLGGYCMGGTIAFEMAQQLYSLGHEVALLALFETYNWAKIPPRAFLDTVRFYTQKIEFHWRNFLLLGSNEKITFFMEKAKEVKRRRTVWYGMIMAMFGDRFHVGDGQHLILSRLWEINDQAAVNYVAGPYPGRITHFRPTKEYALYEGPDLAWDDVACGGVETYKLPVYPAGMLVEPFVRLLAEKLKECIRKALEIERASNVRVSAA